MLVKYFSIISSPFSLIEYRAIEDSEAYDEDDCINNITEELYELGSEDLPEWVEDIRGKIHNEPERVFVMRNDDETVARYFGLSKAE